MTNTSYPGKAYFDNAAKQIKWPIEHKDKQILVPSTELKEAEADLMVSHFRSYGWHVQSVIPGSLEENKIFDPFMVTKGLMRKEEEPKGVSYLGCSYRIKSTGCELLVTNHAGDKVQLRYTNKSKPDINTTVEQLTKVLNMQVWEEI